MNSVSNWRFSLPLGLALSAVCCAPATAQLEPGKRGVLRFEDSPVQSADAEQVRTRLSAIEDPPAYDVAREEFEVLLPVGFDPAKPHGLFIWISAGDNPSIPKEWETELARHDLIFVGARNSGNKRNIFDRMRLAVDANHHLRQLHQIDGRRVYVSGFSGGGRVASMVGVSWAEMFSGTLCFMGANFYTDVTGSDAKVYSRNYLPPDELKDLAKQYCRYVLVTGEKDFNLANTRGVYREGFRAEGFQKVKLLEIPAQGHAMPAAEWLGKALDFLDEGRR